MHYNITTILDRRTYKVLYYDTQRVCVLSELGGSWNNCTREISTIQSGRVMKNPLTHTYTYMYKYIVYNLCKKKTNTYQTHIFDARCS